MNSMDLHQLAKFSGIGLSALSAAVLGIGISNMKEDEDKSAYNMTITAVSLLVIYALLQVYLSVSEPSDTTISSLVLLGGNLLQIIVVSLLGASVGMVDASIKGWYVLAMIMIVFNILLTIVQSGEYMCDAWFANRVSRGGF